ncbi:MAG TPA: glutaredoxin domain-containing protein [Polyangia bacterium]|nr:glutaredoxin domain-containing protein [Polyangia bacterium]
MAFRFPSSRASVFSLVLSSLFLVAAGCRRSAPDAAPAVASAELQVLKDGRYLFTYVEPSGTFATTDKPEIIPEVSRKMVRVVDPAQMKSSEGANVHVVDVDELMKAQKATARPLAREAFETSALAQLPPGESSARQGHAAAPPAGPAADGASAFPSAPGQPVVTVYGTSWCGACRAARQYFSQHKIPFADKDIEADPAAARELAEKASKMGIPTDRVPVLDVRGRLLLGFDQSRVEALLGNPT